MNMSIIIAALIQVESGGDLSAVGDGGKSVGCLQIGIAVIDDVNRVYKTNYTANDRYSLKKSKEICAMYLMHYEANYHYVTRKEATPEVLALMWNMGPSGWGKANTNAGKRYLEKFREALNAKR